MTNPAVIDYPDRLDNGEPENIKGSLSSKLTALLRILGAGSLLIAMYSFLFEGWQNGNDIYRYLMLLGHTGVLALLGLFSGHWLKESKGARLLLTLALVSVPVNFSVLGAFIFSQSPLVDPSIYPQYVAWSVDSLQTALLTTGGAALLLIPVTLIGFAVLSRSMSKKLTLLFLISNAALLLPVRDPQLVGLMVLVLAIGNLVFSRKISNNQISAKTSEGLTALMLQMLPLAILTGRSLWLYSMDLLLLTVLSVTVFFLLRQCASVLHDHQKLRKVFNGLSVLPALATTLFLTAAIFDSRVLDEILALPIAIIISSVMLFDIYRRSDNGKSYLNIAVLQIVIALLLNMTVFSGLAALITAIAGLSLVVGSMKLQHRNMLVAGVVLIVAGLGDQLIEIIQHFDFTSWASLAGFGIVAILLASAMDSQSSRIKMAVNKIKQSFKGWD
ncbi:MAG: hypothetical protein P8Y20_02315 [Gammaproteobacteria bacterium]|jgi:hypothetical protein